MTCIPLRLEAPGLDPLDLSSWPLAAASIDTGFPVVREQIGNRPDADGAIDTTELSGPSVVTLAIETRADAELGRWEHIQRLKAFCNPRLRPTMYAQFPGGVELQATLRIGGFSDVWTAETKRRSRVVTQWVNADGVWHSALEHAVEVSGSEAALGRAYDLAFDRTYPASDPEGQIDAVNAGTRDAFPLIQLHGPWSGLTSVENATAGKALVFNGENVLAGNYIEIDTRAKTIRLNGDPTQNRYQRLVFPASEWWQLAPGVNTLRFEPTTFTAPARMVVAWRDAYA